MDVLIFAILVTASCLLFGICGQLERIADALDAANEGGDDEVA